MIDKLEVNYGPRLHKYDLRLKAWRNDEDNLIAISIGEEDHYDLPYISSKYKPLEVIKLT